MNHLPWPRNDEFPPLEVPYVCADEPEYDGLDFQGYPSRRGWSTSSDPYEWLYCLPGAAAVRAQGWLFFGLLSVFLGPRFRRYDYVKLSQGSDTWVLDTSALPRCLSDTVHSAKKGTLASELSMPNLNAVGELWDNAFLKVKAESEALRAYLNRTLDLKLMLVELPISTLLVSLQRMADRLFWRDDVVPIMCSVELKSATFSGWQMMESKWCENQVQHFYDVYSPFLNHYLSGLPRRSASGDHENCKRDSCVGYNVNEETYEPQHVDDGCYCQYLGPDIRQVTDLLRAGRIPLIRMSVQAGSPVLDVLAADRDTQYISVSHLWSGGLGNFKDNKLPLCQLLKLYELLNNIERFQPQDPFYQMFPRGTLRTISSIPWLIDWRLAQFTTIARQNYRRLLSAEEEGQDSAGLRPIYFWMDTLCIPVSPRYHDLRMKAIGNMALTYAAATKCLVIDPELRRISMKGLTMTQLNAHVLCSGWVRRSWTFQEAKLSRVWYVQFADGLYNPNSVENNELEYRLYSARNTDRSDAHALASEAICWYHDMPPARLVNVYLNQIQWEEFHDPPYRFQAIWNEMVSRSTSKPEDVHGILANLLDLSATEVLTLPLEDRMKAILGEQETLSTGLVYSNGPKVQDQANRWVPVFPSSRYLSPLYGQMKRVSDGYLLDKEKANPVGFIVDKSTPRYSTLRIFDSSSTAGPLWINLASERDGPPVEFKVSGEVLAVIYVVGDLKKSTEHGRRLQGARFGLRRKEEKTLHLVYEYSFAYGHRIRDPFYDRVDEYPIVDAERTPEDTIFQIDCDFSCWPKLSYRRDTTSQASFHGLEFYSGCKVITGTIIWAPFYCLAVLSETPSPLLLPSIFLVLRGLFGSYEIWQKQQRMSERAYKAWVKTFDKSGCLKKREREDVQDLGIGMMVKVSLAVGIAVWLLAVFGDGLGYLRWIGLGIFVEMGVRWGLKRLWEKTRVKRLVRESLKRRGWW